MLFHNIYLTFLALKKSLKKKKMATYSPDFPKLDSNDVWLDECGAANCRKAHNILNNEVMLRPTSNRLMNWWDFLDVLVCYAESAKCGLCCKCNWCLYYFRNLLAEADGLVWSTWMEEGQRPNFYGRSLQPD